MAKVEVRGRDWTTYVWLVYLGFVPIGPALNHAPALEWGWTLAGMVAFLALYVWGLESCRSRDKLWAAAGIAAIGFASAPWNPGTSVYPVFASSFIAYALDAPLAYRVVAGYCAAIAAYSWALHLPLQYWITAIFFAALIGAVNVRNAEMARANAALRLAHGEVARLAQVAERERIARDLHDVIGHTLSLIVLKSELAARLVERDLARAADEVRDIERIARASLGELRDAIAGYRSAGIDAELESAREMLEVAGLKVECDAGPVTLTPEGETVMALAIREAVTNVVRHAGASTCRLSLHQVDRRCTFEIADDGRGSAGREGFGLAGMRERVEALGGSFEREVSPGTRLVLTVPARR